MYGNNVAAQLPTRWFTFVLSGYRGADLRQVLSGQLTTNYTNTTGLFPIPLVNANGGTPAPFFLGTGVDNVAGTLSGFALLGCKVNPGAGTCPSSDVVVAPEHGVRAYGAFAELGTAAFALVQRQSEGLQRRLATLPARRQGPACAQGCRHAAWVTRRSRPQPAWPGDGHSHDREQVYWGDLVLQDQPVGTFGVEPTHYSSRAIPELGNFWIIAGVPSRIWQDQRVEFGPVFMTSTLVSEARKPP
jgi:hypothetical protein